MRRFIIPTFIGIMTMSAHGICLAAADSGTPRPTPAAAPSFSVAPTGTPEALAAGTDCTVKVNGVTLVDSDCDGVPDYLDKCPGTRGGAAVDKDGCPTAHVASVPASAALPVQPPAPAPATAAPEKAGQEPASAEPTPILIEVPIKTLLPRKGMSSTGYFTAAVDRCPPTLESRVVYDGKPLMKLVIHFRENKADIHVKDLKKIKEIHDFMKDNPQVSAHVEGHADLMKGRFDYSMTLSRVRAINIKNRIVRYGDIAPERISVDAYGCAIPVADNRTAEGRRRNRRGVTVITLADVIPAVVK